ncbi:MAG: helix-turn-helix domain-containing protein [bacterium]
MSELIFDRRALGLHPDWEDILIEIIDLELGLGSSPRIGLICGLLLEGYSQREIAKLMKLHHRQIQRELDKIRQGK